MSLLPDDFWDDFENEGGWPGFVLAALIFVSLLLLIPTYVWLLQP